MLPYSALCLPNQSEARPLDGEICQDVYDTSHCRDGPLKLATSQQANSFDKSGR